MTGSKRLQGLSDKLGAVARVPRDTQTSCEATEYLGQGSSSLITRDWKVVKVSITRDLKFCLAWSSAEGEANQGIQF